MSKVQGLRCEARRNRSCGYRTSGWGPFLLRSLGLAALLLAAVRPAAAQPARVLTPEESVRLALEGHPLVEIARAEAAGASAAFRIVQAARRPAFGTTASYTRLSSNIPQIEFEVPPLPGLDTTSFSLASIPLDRYYTHLSVEQVLFSGGRLRNAARAAGLRADAAALAVAQREADVAYEARAAFWTLYRALALQSLTEGALAHVERLVRDVENRRDVGAALENDVLTAQTRRSLVRLDQVEAGNAVRLARLDLNRLAGLPLDAETSVEADPSAGPLPAGADSLAAALARSPRVQMLEAQLRAASAEVRAARGGWLPEVALTGRYVYARPNQYFFVDQESFRGTWEAGVQMTWSLWDGGRRPAEAAQALARRRAVEAQLAAEREEAAVQLARRLLEVERATEAVRVAEQSVREAEAAFRSVRLRFDEGVLLSADVLEAELADRTARARHAGALADYQIARAGLLQALGRVR